MLVDIDGDPSKHATNIYTRIVNIIAFGPVLCCYFHIAVKRLRMWDDGMALDLHRGCTQEAF